MNITFEKLTSGPGFACLIDGKSINGLWKAEHEDRWDLTFYWPDIKPSAIGFNNTELPNTIKDMDIINRFREFADFPVQILSDYSINEEESRVERLIPDGALYFVLVRLIKK